MTTAQLERVGESLRPYTLGLPGSATNKAGDGVVSASIRTGNIHEDDPGSCSVDVGKDEEEARSLF